jgi:hypothetical protein
LCWDIVRRLRVLESDFERAVRDARLEAMRELAYGLSHEINNPLANISARAQLLSTDGIPADTRKGLAEIHEQALRAYDMLADLTLFARPPALDCHSCDIAAFTQEVAGIARELAERAPSQVDVQLEIGEGLGQVSVDANQCRIAIAELCRNGIEAMTDGGVLRISVRIATDSGFGGRSVEFRIINSGPVIDPSTRSKLFDPFYSGRNAGRGLGFGLSKAWLIVTRHGGTIDLESSSPKCTVFRVRLPLPVSAYE